jgi:hypothetical protein
MRKHRVYPVFQALEGEEGLRQLGGIAVLTARWTPLNFQPRVSQEFTLWVEYFIRFTIDEIWTSTQPRGLLSTAEWIQSH